MQYKTIKNFVIIKKTIIQSIQILFGTALIAAATAFFLLPNQISVGGFSGIATITYYFFKIPMGIAIIVLNIPLFIIALIKGGKKYFFNAIFGTVALSVFLNLFENLGAVTNDILLSSIYGGIISGIGTAVVLKANASTGGTELLATIVRMFKPETRTSTMIILFDSTVVLINTICFRGIEIALYSAVAIFVMGKILDIFFEGIDFSKMVLIISTKHDEIADKISRDIRRGITSLYGKGTYKKEEKEVLLCVVSRGEVRDIRRIVKEIDPSAFTIITNAREVFGEGFKE